MAKEFAKNSGLGTITTNAVGDTYDNYIMEEFAPPDFHTVDNLKAIVDIFGNFADNNWVYGHVLVIVMDDGLLDSITDISTEALMNRHRDNIWAFDVFTTGSPTSNQNQRCKIVFDLKTPRKVKPTDRIAFVISLAASNANTTIKYQCMMEVFYK
jgi:hypothetical protein